MPQIGLDQGDQRQQARIAVGRAAPSGGCRCVTCSSRYAHEGCVRAFAVPVQQQRGMRQPGDDATGDHILRQAASVAAAGCAAIHSRTSSRAKVSTSRDRAASRVAPASRSHVTRAAIPHWALQWRTASGRRSRATQPARPERYRPRSRRPRLGSCSAQIGRRDRTLLRRLPGAAASCSGGERQSGGSTPVRAGRRPRWPRPDLRTRGGRVIRSGIIHRDRLAWR